MKTPETYFMENVRLPEERVSGRDFTDAERAFLDKYVGMEQQQVLRSAPVVNPRGEAVVQGFSGPAHDPSEMADNGVNEDSWIREQQEIQLVSFVVGGREFALPITATQEVIRMMPPTKLPNAPQFINGIINLRGRVTPLLKLRQLLGIKTEGQDRFIVVCRHKGLQVGLIIDAVATMYRVGGSEVEWGLESNVGISAQCLVGLLKIGERLIGILSVDSLTHGLLKADGGDDV